MIMLTMHDSKDIDDDDYDDKSEFEINDNYDHDDV